LYGQIIGTSTQRRSGWRLLRSYQVSVIRYQLTWSDHAEAQRGIIEMGAEGEVGKRLEGWRG